MKINNGIIETTKRKRVPPYSSTKIWDMSGSTSPLTCKEEKNGRMLHFIVSLPLLYSTVTYIVLTVISSPPGSSLLVQGPHYLGTPESFEFLTDVVVKPFKRFQFQIPK